MSQIILASASPRRRELLEQIGLNFEVCPAKGEEIIIKKEPKEVVMELAAQKAREVASMLKTYGDEHRTLMTPQDTLVIGADTIVAAGSEILGKPKDEEDAFRMISLLSGKSHSVYTGVAFVFIDRTGRAGEHIFYEKTDVFVRQLKKSEILRYIATGEPSDKAGAYGIQGKFAFYIDKIDGDYNNVVGLPVAAIYRELDRLGIDPYTW